MRRSSTATASPSSITTAPYTPSPTDATIEGGRRTASASSFRECEGNYAKASRACTWLCAISPKFAAGVHT
jgi:hypothetical protein